MSIIKTLWYKYYQFISHHLSRSIEITTLTRVIVRQMFLEICIYYALVSNLIKHDHSNKNFYVDNSSNIFAHKFSKLLTFLKLCNS